MGVATCTQIASGSCNSPLGLHRLQKQPANTAKACTSQPASLTSGFQKPAEACPNSLVMVATSTCRQLATTSGVFHATWLRTANSPLTMAVCYRTHAKYVENSPPCNIFEKDPIWGNIL